MANGNPQTLHYLIHHVTYSESELLLKPAIETRTFRLAVCGFVGVQMPWSDGAKRRELKMDQALGEACGGVDLERCRPHFGDSLEVICRECVWSPE